MPGNLSDRMFPNCDQSNLQWIDTKLTSVFQKQVTTQIMPFDTLMQEFLLPAVLRINNFQEGENLEPLQLLKICIIH